MSYVSFGFAGSSTQWYLPGTNTASLAALAPADGNAPVANALSSG